MGRRIQPPNVPSDRTKFATYHRDEDGWDYADQRYYSPGTGTFLTADPYIASGGAGEPGSWNRYAYVGGDPVNKFDPEGLKEATTFCTAGYSAEDCFGQGMFGSESTGNGNGGMYCDEAKLAFVSTPAQCAGGCKKDCVNDVLQ